LRSAALPSLALTLIVLTNKKGKKTKKKTKTSRLHLWIGYKPQH